MRRNTGTPHLFHPYIINEVRGRAEQRGEEREMSISGMLVSGALPYTAISKPKSVPFSWSATGGGRGRGIVAGIGNGTTGLVVECSSRPQKKATAHHMKTRPKKTQPWDVKRKGPTQYPSLPALPPDWTLVGHQEEEQQQQQQEQEVEEVPSSSE